MQLRLRLLITIGIFAILLGVTIWRPALILRGTIITQWFAKAETASEYAEEDWDLVSFLPPEELAGRILGAQTTKEPKRLARLLPPPPSGGREFKEPFTTARNLDEAGSIAKSPDPRWWVNSGARLLASAGTGKTVQGRLPILDPWRFTYAVSNPTDTDNGHLPQNIFRLVQRNGWTNFSQEVYFKIARVNATRSPQRNASNGVLLFNRYQNGDMLYYTGVRVDGAVVIKKKIRGVYYTMAYKPLFPGAAYHKNKNPNLLPLGRWMGLKSVVRTNSDGSVSILVYIDNGRKGKWVQVAEARDDGLRFGGPSIKSAGYAGIRTDFMDVEFDNYQIKSI